MLKDYASWSEHEKDLATRFLTPQQRARIDNLVEQDERIEKKRKEGKEQKLILKKLLAERTKKLKKEVEVAKALKEAEDAKKNAKNAK